MMNFRTIFQVNYAVCGVGLILFLIFLIFLLERDFIYSCYLIGKYFFIAGFVSFLLFLFFYFIIDIIIPSKYLVFISVISRNLFHYGFILSFLSIMIGLIFLLFYKFGSKRV